MRRNSLAAAVVAATALTGAAAVAAAPSAPPRTPACFGAAARDAAHPCSDPRLRFSVTPKPDDAILQPSSACTLTGNKGPPNRVCAFGVSKSRATATFGLLGDSHAPAWRGAVERLAQGLRWRGLTVRRSSCPFSFAARFTDDAAAAACRDWVRAAIGFFGKHPEVTTLFVVNSANYEWRPGADGADPHAAAVAGYRQALEALPASVRRIVVIRDNPQATGTTLSCVADAVDHGRRPDLRCALPRADALAPDALADAAAQIASPRIRTLDLTRFFCDAARCYPVVGGALVFKDASHITTTFSTSLGPYLLAAYRALPPS